MKSFPARLGMLFACFFGIALITTTSTLLIEYKPYGVPDSRREEYETKVAAMQQRQVLLAKLADQAQPVAVVPVRKHDFGMLDPHATASHKFEIRNEGEHPLALQIEQTSCKCTIGKLANDLLGPGEFTDVTLTWNTGYQADDYEQTATIRTNDPARSLITLSVTGEVRAELIVPEVASFHASDMGEVAQSRFVVFSQVWDDFTVFDVNCELAGFEWYAEPVAPTDSRLADREAKSAWEIHLQCVPQEYGLFTSEVSITARPAGGQDDVIRELACGGKVRSPINFYSPDIHKTEGLDIGTLVAGKEHEFHLVVRSRSSSEREIEVLDVQPEQLLASLDPLETPGSYRLTLKVPADCPMVVFNASQEHGYVQVGDPLNRNFSNWFPVHGAVVQVQP